MNKRIIWRWAKVALLLYAVVGIAAYYGQDWLLFHPRAVARETVYDFGGQPHTELNLPYDKGTNLNIVEFRAVPPHPIAIDTPRGVVLYFHGNRHNVEWYSGVARDFTLKGYEVWIMDYPGFGKSTGVFSEQKLYDYALVCYKLARSRWPPSRIIIYGRSFGTGIAAQLADVRDCRRLILESPAYSLESMGAYYLPVYPWSRLLHYHFPTYSHLPAVTAPITIFEGTKDRTVPYSNASRLKPLLKSGDEFITIEGAGHNDLHNFPLFREKLDSVLEQ
jgi:alpha-beta hydrolase superfamily lysophospholipase